MMKGHLIVIEGTDGSGKATQTKRIKERLLSEGYAVEVVEFPCYGNPSAAMVEAYLNGKFGAPNDVGPYAASIFYAVDRYAKGKEMRSWLAEGKIVLCNRYMTANKGHQAGKIKNLAERDKYLDWLDDLEFNIFGIPKPDKIFLMYMPFRIAQRLVANKDLRTYLGDKKMDIHEADLNHLKDAEEAYIYVAKKEGWDVIDCSQDDDPLPIDVIFENIYAKLKGCLK